MPEQNDKVYQFAPLTDYTLKQRTIIRLADIAFYGFIKILGSLTRFEVRGIEHLHAIEAAGTAPILTLWHDRIFLGLHFWRDRGIVVLTSQSFDGEYIARFSKRLGFGAVRGSSSRGGARAMVEMVKVARKGYPTAFTVDGPRGPRYEAKLGPVILAKRSGNPILPFLVEPRRFWTLNSWDKMQIPVPFSRAIMLIGEPIFVDADATDDAVNSKLGQLQRSLDELVAQGNAWSGRAE